MKNNYDEDEFAIKKVYNDRFFSRSPKLKVEDLKVGMQVITYQLDDIKGVYITLDNTFSVMDKMHVRDLEGTITKISDNWDYWKTSDSAVLVYNNPITIEYYEL